MTTSTGNRPTGSRTLPLLPLRNGVVFPEMVVTIQVESDEARHAVDAALAADQELLLVPIRPDSRPAGQGDEYASVGTIARVEQRDGTDAVVIRAIGRARAGQGTVDADSAALLVEATEIVDGEITATIRELEDELRDVATRILTRIGGRRLTGILNDVASPGALADTLGWWPDLSQERKIELLETVDVEARLRLALVWAREADLESEVATKIRDEVNGDLEKTQRDAILRRQMEAIRSELDEGDDDAVGEYRAKLTDGDYPEAVHTALSKEIDRLERVGEQSQESSWIRTWLDTMFEVPWTNRTDDRLELGAARDVLDADHTGLDDVKERIIEFLAVRKRQQERGLEGTRRSGTILALAGPPGVGKTSLGESVARALGREFVRMSLGGIHDEAEIRGHRRTYVGARPGRIVRSLIDAGTMNPVVLLDEIDKVGADYRGDPSSALLEVLDPAQNKTFRDHYAELDIDLSEVFFIATANVLDRIPGPLLDRMEIITIDGYSEDEKVAIATDHLLPRLRDANAVDEGEVTIGEDVLRTVVGEYTREAGVRRLEQRLDRLMRRAVTRLATEEGITEVTIEVEELHDALGHPIPREDPAERTSVPGVATGLAVTGAGGDVLFVEVAQMDGEPGLTLTGQLGDVMQESGTIALSYLRSRRDELGIADISKRRFHVHFPAGGVPKDGPSAGVTMTTALVSLLTNRRVRGDVAMTGEITLQGRVLPIGGVKQKVLAAHRAGIRTVILPAANQHDANDIPDNVRDAVELHFVSDIGQVLELALEPAPEAQ